MNRTATVYLTTHEIVVNDYGYYQHDSSGTYEIFNSKDKLVLAIRDSMFLYMEIEEKE